MRLLRFVIVVLAVSGVAIFFAYPPLLEDSDGECSALEQRVADLASHDAAGLLTIHPLYGSTSSAPSGAAFVRDRYPLLPRSVGCAVAYWRAVFDPQLMNPDVVAKSLQPPGLQPAERKPADLGLHSIIARDITPNGDPISPASVFTLPMEAVAIRVDYPSDRVGVARFQVLQGKSVLSSCTAERSTPGIAWCRFSVSLRKGNYSITLTANNVRLGQFPFAVIGR